MSRSFLTAFVTANMLLTAAAFAALPQATITYASLRKPKPDFETLCTGFTKNLRANVIGVEKPVHVSIRQVHNNLLVSPIIKNARPEMVFENQALPQPAMGATYYLVLENRYVGKTGAVLPYLSLQQAGATSCKAVSEPFLYKFASPT